MVQIRVMLVDDHLHVHEAVRLTLQDAVDVQLVAMAYSGDEAYGICQKQKTDVILMDVVMPQVGGLETTIKILKDFPDVKILVLSSYQDVQHVRALLEAGAIGYTLKSTLSDNLVDAIRAAYSGSTVMAPEISQKLLDLTTQTMPAISESHYKLTEREIEVLQLMAQGLNNKEIAQKLFISRSTVKFHIANVIEKMAVETRAEAIVLAAKSNLV